ncbi:carboxymuconolactone decarboxylase family protein [Sphingomonas sp. BIUV-7]|uniref:Carboxymuconolactone decarboxylase family protein n=1 Tax=Sphingomonas natans TaxID=3063330 RepID=A0ABT8Y892_9SPHN|nr:carboxymuconolactone decarboxylase family protein [Sphingomonas sp. BIUV-7]MDO6414528.1 carboxymuconolactone decarboxylase family protein [Sphingomonas sp. BIUV-7]
MSEEMRRATGRQTFEEILGLPAGDPATPLMVAAQDFVFAEVWNRPGLDRRSRRWITLASVAAAGSPTAIHAYALAGLASGDLTMPELREFTLQFAIFQGFPKAVEVERILDEIARAQEDQLL